MNILHLLLLFVIPLALVLVPLFVGQRFGHNHYLKKGKDQESPLGAVVGAAFGLLAFLLAFTFQMVDNRYSARKDLLLKESLAIRNAFNCSGFIPDSMATESRTLIREYVRLRVELRADHTKTESLVTRSQEIINRLWQHAETLNRRDKSSEAYSQFAGTITELSNQFRERLTVAFIYRIPPTILWILAIATLFSMFLLGYQIGASGKLHTILHVLLGLVFTAVIWLILILDRPELGIAPLNQQPMIDLHEDLQNR